MRFSIVLSALLVLSAFGCKDASPADAEIEVPEVSVEQAAKSLTSGAVAVDANGDRTRKKFGTVPSAVLLTSASKFDLAQLPTDKAKDLIFYCSNTFCTASDTAAERAAENGYKNVHVMRQGIKGWKEAGNPVQSYPQS